MIVTNENIHQVIRAISDSPMLALDTETTGLRPYHGDRVFSAILSNHSDSFYFNFGEYEEVVPTLSKSIYHALNEAVAGKRVFLANAKFDVHFLTCEGWELNFQPWDVLVADKCIYNRHLKYDLKSVAERYGFKKSGDVMDYISEHRLYDRVKQEGKKTESRNPRFDRVPFHIISEYGMQDGRITYDIGVKQLEKIKELDTKYRAIKGYNHSFVELVENEMKLIPVLFGMEKRGMEVDSEYIKKAVEHEKKRIEEACAGFEKETGFKLVDSAKGLNPALAPLGVVHGTTEKGRESYTDDILRPQHQIQAVAHLLEYRDATKRCNTYYLNFAHCADRNGVIRPSIKQSAADTFRFSIVEPALQTLNSEDAGEWRVRDSFRARQDYLYVSIDYQAQEPRLCADLAGERDLIDKINSGTDVHTATAELLGVERKKAKAIGLGLLYGMGAKKMAASLGISEIEAKSLKDKYFSQFPKIHRLIMGVMETVDRRGYIFNPFGRVLYFPVISWIDEKTGRQQKSNLSYKGINYLIQSTGSEIMRAALIRLDKFLFNHKSKIILSIHDSIEFEIHESELYLIPEIQKIMETSYTPKNGLGMKTTVEGGKKWGTLVDIDDKELAQRIYLQKTRSVTVAESSEDNGVHHSTNITQGDPGSTMLREWGVRGA